MTYSCTLQDKTYSAFLNLWHLIIYSLCPSFVMLVFGCLTLRNIRTSQHTVAQNANNDRINQRRNATLLRMLLAQVLLILITTGPRSVYQIYALFTLMLSRTQFEQISRVQSVQYWVWPHILLIRRRFICLRWVVAFFEKKSWKFSEDIHFATEIVSIQPIMPSRINKQNKAWT